MLSNGNILCYEKKKCAFLFSVAVGKQAIRTDQETHFALAQDMVFELVHQCFVIHISLIRVNIPCSDDCV